MRQKGLLAAALMHNPDLILMDEPFSGLNVGSSLVLRSLIQELAVRGKVILFSSHELETVERICSHVVILHRGKLLLMTPSKASKTDGPADAGRNFLSTRCGAGCIHHFARDCGSDSCLKITH